jgi:hypothetical protein
LTTNPLIMRFVLLYCTPIVLCCLLFTTPARSQLQKIYLNPKTVAREKQSKFVDSIRFIPLEIKQGIEIGAYYSIEVTPKYFLLSDYMNKRFLLYSKAGQFVKTINYAKLGGNFYPAFQEHSNQITFFGNNKNYTLTAKDQVKIKLDWDNPRNRKYFKKYTIDLNDPALTIKKDIPTKQDILRVNHYYDDYYIQGQINTSPIYKDSLDHEIKLYKNNQLVKSFFAYNHISEPRFLFTEENVNVNKTGNPFVHFITRPYCDTIYRMTKDSLSAAYQLVLPLENSLPPTFFSRPFKNRTERDNFARNNGWMFRQAWNFYETPRFIFFLVGYFSNVDSYIYEKQTDITYKSKNIRADSTQYNLPLFSDFSIMRKGDRFYKSQKAAELLAFFDKNKNVPVPAELHNFVKGKPPANTPVIIEFKFKN